MRTELLQTFLQVVASGSFQAAGKGLQINQSTVSRQIQALEDELGAPLLERGVPCRLTVAGERFLPHARKLWQEWQRAQESIRELMDGKQTELCIAGIHSLLAYHLPPVLERFGHEYPGVQLRVTALGSDRALKVLHDGLVDLALVMDNPLLSRTATSWVEPLYSEPIRVLMAAAHPLAQWDEIPWAVIASQPQAVFRDGYAMRSLITGHLAKMGLSLKVALELNTLDAFRGVVKQGQLIALLPESALWDGRTDPGLVIRPTETPALERHVVAVTTKDRYEIPPIQRFLDLAVQHIRAEREGCPA
ncbi:MAG: LysR family transcriptional regulator [Synechococcales cyanobacterium]